MAGNIKRMVTALAAAGGAAGLAVVVGLSGASAHAQENQYPLPPTTTIAQAPPPPLPTPAPLPPVATIPATGGTSLTEGVMIGSTLAVAGFGLVIVSHRRRGGDASLSEGT